MFKSEFQSIEIKYSNASTVWRNIAISSTVVALIPDHEFVSDSILPSSVNPTL